MPNPLKTRAVSATEVRAYARKSDEYAAAAVDPGGRYRLRSCYLHGVNVALYRLS